MSNWANKSRNVLSRPKVCLSPKFRGPKTGPTKLTCALTAGLPIYEWNGTNWFLFDACSCTGTTVQPGFDGTRVGEQAAGECEEPPPPCACANPLIEASISLFENIGCFDCNTTIGVGRTLTLVPGQCEWKSGTFPACGVTLHWSLIHHATNDWRIRLMDGTTIKAYWKFAGEPTISAGICQWFATPFSFVDDDGNGWCNWFGPGINIT